MNQNYIINNNMYILFSLTLLNNNLKNVFYSLSYFYVYNHIFKVLYKHFLIFCPVFIILYLYEFLILRLYYTSHIHTY